MDSKLTAEQEKLAALIESDYALLKFGYYGQEYEFVVAERDPRRTIINLSQIKTNNIAMKPA